MGHIHFPQVYAAVGVAYAKLFPDLSQFVLQYWKEEGAIREGC